MTFPWRSAVVVGASSGIGAAIARELAGAGVRLALVARRADALAGVARAVAPAHARIHPHDVRDVAGVARLVARIVEELPDLDLLVYAAGILPRIGATEYPSALDAEVVAVNLTGAMAWIDAIVPRFVAARRGTVIGVSSVAGDRGRRGYPAYHASKAGLNAFLEAVRNRVAMAGVRVVTAKPGPVDTPMSRGLDRLPLLIPAERAARGILAGASRGRRVVYVPAIWRAIMLGLRAIPSVVFERLDI